MNKIKIAHLYYDLMNLYGENGNIRFLSKKLEDQGFQVEIQFLTIDDKLDFSNYDICYIGMGSEENKNIILPHLINYKNDIKTSIDNKKFFIITGNSIDLFAKTISKQDGTITSGLETFDYNVTEEEFRIVGEQCYTSDIIKEKIIGFQNRNSVIDNSQYPLFNIISGTGYNPNNKKEGIHKNNFYGTYLLGPILIRNPHFTDYLIKEICKYKNKEYIKPNKKETSYLAYDEYIKNFYNNQK